MRRRSWAALAAAVILATSAIALSADPPTGVGPIAGLLRDGRYAEAEAAARGALDAAEHDSAAAPEAIAGRLDDLALVYRTEGRYAEAAPFLVRAVAVREKLLGVRHPAVASSLSSLGTLYRSLGDYAEAEKAFKRALSIRKSALGRNHLDLAESLADLAELDHALGRRDEAGSLRKRALAIFELALAGRKAAAGDDDLDLAALLVRMARLNDDDGRHALAEQLHARALAIRQRLSGPDSLIFAASLNDLADLFVAQSRYAEAMPYYERALAIREKTLGADHPEVAAILDGLAALYYLQGRTGAAQQLYERALAVREKSLAAGSPDLATSLGRLAELYLAKGRYAEAEQLYKRALAIQRKTLGPNHPKVATGLRDLAGLDDALDRTAEAAALRKQALAIREKALERNDPALAESLVEVADDRVEEEGVDGDPERERLRKRALAISERALAARMASLGPDHPGLATLRLSLAKQYKDLNRYTESEPQYLQAAAILESALGGDSPALAASLEGLADLYDWESRFEEKEAIRKRALAIWSRAIGPDSPAVAEDNFALALDYISAGRSAEALPLLERYLAHLEMALGPGAERVLDSLDLVSRRLYLAGLIAEAEPYYKRALAIREKTLGPDDENLAEPLDELADLYDEQGRAAESKPLRERAAALRRKAGGDSDRRNVAAWLEETAFDMVDDSEGQFDDEPIQRRILAIREKMLGPEHPDVAQSLETLATLYAQRGRNDEAETFFLRALALREKTEGSDDAGLVTPLLTLAEFYDTGPTGRQAEAEPLLKRALAIQERVTDAGQGDLSDVLSRLAGYYFEHRRNAEAAALYLRALTLLEKKSHDTSGMSASNLFQCLLDLAGVYAEEGRLSDADALLDRARTMMKRQGDDLVISTELGFAGGTLGTFARNQAAQGHFGEAESLHQRALAIDEAMLDAPVDAIRALARFYDDIGRMDLAEPLYKNLLATEERLVGLDDPKLSGTILSLADLYYSLGAVVEAEPLYQRALALQKRRTAPDDTAEVQTLQQLANVYRDERRFSEADDIYRRMLAIKEKTNNGGWMPQADYADTMENLASSLMDQGRYAEAELLCRRAIAIRELDTVSGPRNPALADNLALQGDLQFRQGRMAEAEPLYRRALAIRERALGAAHPDVADSLVNLAAVLVAEGRHEKAIVLARRAAAILQSYLASGASQDRRRTALARRNALVQLAAARALIEPEAPDRDRLMSEALEAMQRVRNSSVAGAVAQMAARFAAGSDALAVLVREREDAVNRLRALDARLIQGVSKPPAERDLKAEAADRAASATLAASIRQYDDRLARAFPAFAEIANPQPATLGDLQALLAPDEAAMVYVVADDRSYAMVARHDRAELIEIALPAKALREAVSEIRGSLTFDDVAVPDDLLRRGFAGNAAFRLYKALFAPAEAVLAGARRLYVVPDDALESLPLGVLLTDAPKDAFTDFSAYATAPWLARRQALVTLPSISSLRALRQFAGASRATQPFVGVGAPALKGDQGQARGATLVALFRGATADPDELNRMPALPEAAVELSSMAKALGADEGTLLTGAAATETNVRKAPLAAARVVAFATHAAVAGEIRGFAEPALVLTPPQHATLTDDGLLTASEVAHSLKLDADWVVLSACNTAAADGSPGAEGLSGLAKAFFYAGARALLVSHWSVESNATVRLTTGTVAALAGTPGLGRAEALQQAELAMLNDPDHPYYAHPAFWAPFVLVGEGAGAR